MRATITTLLLAALCFAVATHGTAREGTAGEEQDPAPTPEKIAEWIKSGDDAALDKAAQAAVDLDVKTLKRVFQALHAPTGMRAVLAKKHIKGLVWEEANLDSALAYLRTISGLNFYVTPKVREEKLEDVLINLHIDDVALDALLSLITEPYELAWKVNEKDKVVMIGTTEEFQTPVNKPADLQADTLRKKVDATTVNVSVEEASFSDVVKTLQIQTGLNIVIDPRIAQDVADQTVSNMVLTDAPLGSALDMLAHQISDDGTWTCKGNVILLTRKEFLRR